MRKLIRNQITKLFLTSEGGWTNDPLKAWEMEGILDALETAKRLKLTDVELSYAYEERSGGQSIFFTISDFPVSLTLAGVRPFEATSTYPLLCA